MESTQQRNGVLHWLNENFECIFMVSGLLMIIFFITWQVVYRYIITQFIERAGAAVWTEELSGCFCRYQEAFINQGGYFI